MVFPNHGGSDSVDLRRRLTTTTTNNATGNRSNNIKTKSTRTRTIYNTECVIAARSGMAMKGGGRRRPTAAIRIVAAAVFIKLRLYYTTNPPSLLLFSGRLFCSCFVSIGTVSLLLFCVVAAFSFRFYPFRLPGNGTNVCG